MHNKNLVGLFGKRIEVKNATKTTYSVDDLKKLDMDFRNVFQTKGKKRIYTPFRKEIPRAWRTRMRDLSFESILDKGFFTFKHLLVVPDPYGASIQTAMLIFNTQQECRVRYRVIGKLEGTDFVGETGLTTRHRVPVMGLYKGYTNRLELELLDAAGEVIQRRELRIYCRDIGLSLQNIVTKVEHSVPTLFPFILVNGLRFRPIVYDQNGEVRYSLKIKTNRGGMIQLQNDRFLYPDLTVGRVGKNGMSRACQYHEMDYMGRIYRTYLLDYPIGNLAALNGDSLFLLTSSQKKYVNDCIVEIDRKTGKEVKRCALADEIGTKYQNRRGWLVPTSMTICAGQLLLTSKRFHTIFSFDLATLKINWLLAPVSIWRGTPLEDKLLVSVDEQKVDGYMPENLDVLVEKENILHMQIYYIQNKGSLPDEGAVSDDDSRIDFYDIDTASGTFTKKRSVAVVKSKRNGSCIYREDEERLLSLSGLLMRRSENLRACIEELDGKTGKMVNRLRLYKAYRSAWLFEPNIEAYDTPLSMDEEVLLGSLDPPEPFTGELPEEAEEKLKKRFFGNVRLCGNILLFGLRPGFVQRVYLIGKEHSYVQDFSTLKKKKRRSGFCIALDQLEIDEYQIYVEFEDKAYHLKNEIRIEQVKNKKGKGK